MPAETADAEDSDTPLVAPSSSMTPADREARRFGRYDKDHDARISRDEYLANRKKAFEKLDLNGDGRLGFDEYSAAAVKKFGRADRDGNGALVAAEFAATAVRRHVNAPPPCVPEG